MSCRIPSNTSIGPPEYHAQFWQFVPSLEKNAICIESTYLRPDAAGSILPWPYTLMWLLIHTPLVLIRVVRWQRVQVLSIVLAATTMALTIEAFLSTQRKASEVLVWTPLTLILDVGSMMQLVYLILEDIKDQAAKKQENGGPVAFWKIFNDLIKTLLRSQVRSQTTRHPTRSILHFGPELQIQPMHNYQLHPSRSTGECSEDYKPSKSGAVMVILSLLFMIGLVALQIIGLASAIYGFRDRDKIESIWCSTMFDSFALGVLDGNCHMHTVSPGATHGIGCINLPGDVQSAWLLGTIAILAVSLMLEVMDCLILALVGSRDRWKGVKMKRPWCTMFFGLAILIFLMIYGILDTSRLPNGMSEVVWVFQKEPSFGYETVCRGTITPAGVRGAIMGWTDGLLSNWGPVYFG